MKINDIKKVNKNTKQKCLLFGVEERERYNLEKEYLITTTFYGNIEEKGTHFIITIEDSDFYVKITNVEKLNNSHKISVFVASAVNNDINFSVTEIRKELMSTRKALVYQVYKQCVINFQKMNLKTEKI